MATKTVVCPDCQETVPYGRLSCPACGALLAAVAGAARRTEPLKVVAVNEESSLADDVPPPPDEVRPAPPVRRRTRAATAAAAAVTAAKAQSEPVAPPATAEMPAADFAGLAPKAAAPALEPAAVEPAAVAPARAAGPALAPRTTTRISPPASTPAVLRDWPADTPLPSALASPSRTFEAEENWDDGDDDADAAHPDVEAAARPEAPPRPPSRPDAAGAYLPPSATLRPAPDGGSVVAGAAYGRATATPMRSEPVAGPASQPAGPAAEARPKLKPGQAPFLADLPFDAPDTLPGWLTVAGSGIVSISFFLPWAPLLLGGGQLTNTFTDGWGLGNPSHLLVLLASVSVLALALVPNRMPSWVRSGVLPILLGGLVLGLVWPYFFANLAQFGALLTAAGAVVLAIGGILALRPSRHDGGGTSV